MDATPRSSLRRALESMLFFSWDEYDTCGGRLLRQIAEMGWRALDGRQVSWQSIEYARRGLDSDEPMVAIHAPQFGAIVNSIQAVCYPAAVARG